MATKQATKNVIYRHKQGFGCKIVKRVTWDEINENRAAYMIRGFILRVCECGKTQQGATVVGSYKAEEKCGAKCQSSKGPACECSCEGRNHGGSYVA